MDKIDWYLIVCSCFYQTVENLIWNLNFNYQKFKLSDYF